MGNVIDDSTGTVADNSEPDQRGRYNELNAGRYHRWYSLLTNTNKRLYKMRNPYDTNVYMAKTTRPEVNIMAKYTSL